ncbi:hypothetical protein F4810DRAFT_188397 [Camillea tinctor]|nr:hypothetical protein F4810DRAFT_188397 [Camillea tinctor]
MSSNATSVDTGAATTSSAPEETSSITSLTSLTDSTSTTATPDPTTSESSATTPTTTEATSTSESTPTSEPTTTSTSTTAPPTTSSTTTEQTTPTTAPSTTSTTSVETTPSATSTTEAPSTTSTSSRSSSLITTTQITTGSNGSTQFVTITSTIQTESATETGGATTTSSGAGLITSSGSSSGSLNQSSKIAVSVVVPIAAVALLVVAGIFFWRKRKQRKDAEEERRKEVEDYSYNPNNDPTLPDVNSAGGAYEMKEDSSGYRGWGSTTLGGSTGRKASITMSGGTPGAAYSDATSPSRGNFSDTRSGEALMGDGSRSPEGEILGAMGPTTTDTRAGNVHRGPSNASSSYSAAGRSDGSADNGVAYGGPPYYDQYGNSNPYVDNPNPGQQVGGQPVIRDNPARRNTRIENPSHYPQQSAGISQNF